MSFFRAAFLLRVGLVCALLISGCTLPSVVGQPNFQGDTLVGADTWSFTDITLRPSLQQALQARDVMDLFDGPLQDAGADLHNIPTASGRTLDFEQDLLPHLDGEIIVAVAGPTEDPQVILLAHTNDVDGMLRLASPEAQPKLNKDARGVTTYASGSGPAEAAGYKNWIIYTESAALRGQTLDRIDGKGGPSLAQDTRYRAVVDRLKGDRLGFGYINISPLVDRAVVEDARLSDALKGRGRVAYTFGFEPGPDAGVHVLGVRVEYAPDTPMAVPAPDNGDTLLAMDRLPKASMLALAGPDLGMYSESLTTLSDDEDLADDLNALLQQFDGPYALGVTTPTIRRAALTEDSVESAVSTLLGGLFFIARIAPNADTQLLSDAAEAFAQTATSEDEASGWQHEVVIDNEWLAVNAVPPRASLDDLPEDLLASDRTYQWVRSGFLANGTNIFINLETLEQALLGELLSSDEMAAFKPFKAIGVSSQSEPQGDGHAHMTVLIVGE